MLEDILKAVPEKFHSLIQQVTTVSDENPEPPKYLIAIETTNPDSANYINSDFNSDYSVSDFGLVVLGFANANKRNRILGRLSADPLSDQQLPYKNSLNLAPEPTADF